MQISILRYFNKKKNLTFKDKIVKNYQTTYVYMNFSQAFELSEFMHAQLSKKKMTK